MQFQRPWHDPQFMNESTPEDVEKWLLSLVQSTNAKEKGNRSRSSNSSHNPIVYFDEGFNVDAIAYLRVLEAYARSNMASAPQRAEHWIGILERHYSAALELFVATYKQTTNNTQQQEAAAIVRSLQPTVECYNSLIEVWGHDKNPISVVRSRRWLSKLEDEATNISPSTNGHSLGSILRPNAKSYDLYLHSCSRGIGKQFKQHQAWAEEAGRMLDYRLSSDAPLAIRPTTESFNYVLRAYTRCRKDISIADKAMSVVLRMEKIKKSCLLAGAAGENSHVGWQQNIAPDSKTYTMLLDAWIVKAGLKATKWRSKQLARINTFKHKGRGEKGCAEFATDDQQEDGTQEMKKAEMILNYMHNLDSTGHNNALVTVFAYNILLSGWARLANEIQKNVPLKSEKLLHEMIALAEKGHKNIAPDVTVSNCAEIISFLLRQI